jgi:nucleoid-associated protein YgaU
MPKVICTLPNAAAEINGVKFSLVEGGMLSDEVSAEQAESFLAIPGYAEHKEDPEAEARRKAEIAAQAQREADEATAKAAAAAKARQDADAAAIKAVAAKAAAPAPAPVKAVKPAKADAADDDTTF